MKKVLLAAFLLTAGVITSENANAQTSEPKPIPTAPPAVLKAIQADYDYFEENNPGTQTFETTWYAVQGNFYAVTLIYDDGNFNGVFYRLYTPKGERLN